MPALQVAAVQCYISYFRVTFLTFSIIQLVTVLIKQHYYNSGHFNRTPFVVQTLVHQLTKYGSSILESRREHTKNLYETYIVHKQAAVCVENETFIVYVELGQEPSL